MTRAGDQYHPARDRGRADGAAARQQRPLAAPAAA